MTMYLLYSIIFIRCLSNLQTLLVKEKYGHLNKTPYSSKLSHKINHKSGVKLPKSWKINTTSLGEPENSVGKGK